MLMKGWNCQAIHFCSQAKMKISNGVGSGGDSMKKRNTINRVLGGFCL